MSAHRILLQVACLLGALSVPISAQAVVCTIQGKIEIDSMDSYYCDTASLNCVGWKEVDLDTVRKPLRYLHVVMQTTSGGFLGDTYTDPSGNYSESVALSGTSCAGKTVRIRLLFERKHENEVILVPGRYRFRVAAPLQGDITWSTYVNKKLIGPTTTRDWIFFNEQQPNVNENTRAANIYYTADSAISEMVTWNPPTLDDAFAGRLSDNSALRIWVDNGWTPTCGTGCADCGLWLMHLWPTEYGAGATIRHELGHLAHCVVHDKKQSRSCNSNLLNNVSGWNERSSEWSPWAMQEGLATFFGTRSIVTSADTNVWSCSAKGTGPDTETGQPLCSRCAGVFGSALGAADRVADCGGAINGIVGIGDVYASAKSHCVRETWDGFCPTDDGGMTCSNYQDLGHRNVVQIERFFWDMLDFSTDGGNDDTTRTMSELVAHFEQMPCTGSDFGENHSCNEPARTNPGCNPHDPPNCCVPIDQQWPVPATAMGTRDSYNPYDLAWFIDGDQTNERWVNCVDEVTD